MPLITNLPAASSLSASDLLVIDTGSTTQKLAVSNAYASETAPGFVSTAAQTFSGIKTFKANTINLNSGIAYPGLLFYNPASDSRFGGFRFNLGAATPDRTAAYIEQASLSGGTPTGFFENYYLPRTDDGRTASVSYNILTTKNYQMTEVQRLSIPANGSVTITLAAESRGLALISGYSSNTKGIAILCSTSSTASSKLIGDPTNITITGSGLSLTIASTYGYAVAFEMIMFVGGVTV